MAVGTDRQYRVRQLQAEVAGDVPALKEPGWQSCGGQEPGGHTPMPAFLVFAGHCSGPEVIYQSAKGKL